MCESIVVQTQDGANSSAMSSSKHKQDATGAEQFTQITPVQHEMGRGGETSDWLHIGKNPD